ncbi:hypothetical protein [Cohnella nanjingensis]|uniref:Uncharacterized protein n=1 Tax=Cohnella nanjingensis TaxID=1387779 RepID=A0A7X0RR13_9BACL|nr:hypothetical protein [Cohnella nanjingensis]MBB6672117.1 hypothetical protein [Cohnella nanjingensis]
MRKAAMVEGRRKAAMPLGMRTVAMPGGMRTAAIACCAALMLIMTGCGAFYQPIEKDTVMVRKINKQQPNPPAAYEGILSAEAVKTLSVSAMAKYLDLHAKKEELSFEVLSVDAPSINQALANLNGLQGDARTKMSGGPEAEPLMKSPVYFVTISYKDHVAERITAILQAETGEVLGIAVNDYRASVVQEPSKPSKTQIKQIADDYLRQIGHDVSNLEMDDVYASYGMISAFYYRAKGSKRIVVNLLVDMRSQKVISYMKDEMVGLQFYNPYMK